MVQRVRRASCAVGGDVTGDIGVGMVVLAGFTEGDDETTLDWMARKVAGLRIFPDDDGNMNRSLHDAGGAMLIVSQFTLYGDVTRGKRPSFIRAAPPETAIPLYDAFVARMRESGVPVQTGEFGADMDIDLVNWGPVTLVIER